MTTYSMQGSAPFMSYAPRSGNSYTANANAQLTNVAAVDIADLEASGCSLIVASLSTSSHVANSNSATSGTALTAAHISGAMTEVFLTMTGTLGAGANATLPTVANLRAALNNPVQGQTYRLRIINASGAAFAWTVVTNTGWTLSGTMTIAQNTWRDFIVTIGTGNTATLAAVGTGTNS